MAHPNRTWAAADGNYRYGFNGVEKEGEVYGKGHLSSMGFRMYDPRVGRWWGVDKIVKVHESPYAAFFNNPINYADPSGLDEEKKSSETSKTTGNAGDNIPKDDWGLVPSGLGNGTQLPMQQETVGTVGSSTEGSSSQKVLENPALLQMMQQAMSHRVQLEKDIKAAQETQQKIE